MLDHGGFVEIEKQGPTHETTYGSATITGDRPGLSFETPCGCRSGHAYIDLCISFVLGGAEERLASRLQSSTLVLELYLLDLHTTYTCKPLGFSPPT
jgi:hypothetical protein